MDKTLKTSLIILIWGFGILVGQAILITYHSVEYWESRECEPQITLQAQIKPSAIVEEEYIDVPLIEDWTDWEAKSF